MTVEFGFGLITCQRYPGDPRSDADLYRQALALAEDADAFGLDSVWVSEHHFVDDAYLPSLLPMCAAIAARTRRVQVGTALLLAPLYEPVRLAEDAAVVDLISGGRLVLCLGLGWRAEEFDALGIPLAGRVPRLLAAVDVLRQAWRGDLVRGGHGANYPDVPVRPLPAQPGGPPLWIGGLTEPAIRRAGRVADGFMATEVTPDGLREQAALAGRERARTAATGPFTISVHLPTFVWDGPGGWDLIRDHHRYVAWKYEDMDTARSRAGGPAPPPPLAPGEEEQLRSSIVMGTPDEVARQIDAYRRAAGGDLHYIARLYFPGLPWEVQQRTLRLFAEQVIPQARALATEDAA
ncbi:MAG TPA: LLM class flavin-dependent oxidoreductase [Streptosporangiaceae bacterium]|nr:LLM class flavin-dependent oxidoreductase [Streptosporangiaceae bacterium]